MQTVKVIVNEIGTDKYFDVLCKGKVKLTPELSELGPILRLAILFELINSRPGDARERTYTIACEIFSNLNLIEDLKLLGIIDIGENGRIFYSKLADIAVKEKATWQIYAASVYFGVPKLWIKKLTQEEKLPGELGKKLEPS